MLPTIMNRGPIDPWTRTPRSVAPSSTWAASYLRPSSAAFITTIAESSFQYTQGLFLQAGRSLAPGGLLGGNHWVPRGVELAPGGVPPAPRKSTHPARETLARSVRQGLLLR